MFFPPEVSDPAMLALVLACFLLGGFAKGLVGLGMPVVVLAALAPVIGVPTSLALMVVPAMLTNVWQALDGGALGAILRRLWPFYIAAAIGVQLGGAVLASSSETVLLGLLGAVLVVYAAVSLLSPQLPAPGRHEVWMAPSAALAGGVMFGMVGNFIVPGILYLQALGLRRDLFVQTLGVTFIVISSALAVSLSGHHVLTPETAALGAVSTLPGLLGMVIGRRCRRYVSEDGFRRIFFIALLAVGVQNLARAFL